MHLLVLSAFRPGARGRGRAPSWFQCTFWCSVLSDPQSVPRKTTGLLCFNAPFGAQCFPTIALFWSIIVFTVFQCTFWCSVLSDPTSKRRRHNQVVLFQCTFWCSVLSDGSILSAKARVTTFQCTFWCSVLSDPVSVVDASGRAIVFQCTFWCSVLSDDCLVLVDHCVHGVSMHLLVLSAFRPCETTAST